MKELPNEDLVPRLEFGQFYGRVLHAGEAGGISVRELTDLPPHGVPRHTHGHAHFCLVISGRYESATRNLRGRCPPFTLLFHPAGATHEDRFLAPGGRALVISLGSSFVETIGEPLPSGRSMALDDARLGFPGSRMRRELRARDRFSAMSLEGLVVEMIAHVLARAERREARRPRWLARAVSFLRDRAADPVCVAEVAEAAGVHPVHLARVFRHHLGLTPGEYLRRSRVRAAMDLIERTPEPLATIAIRSGFCDQSEMTRAFRREIDTTPGAYQRTVRG